MKKIVLGLGAIAALTGSVMAANNTGISVQTRSAHFLTDAKGMHSILLIKIAPIRVTVKVVAWTNGHA